MAAAQDGLTGDLDVRLAGALERIGQATRTLLRDAAATESLTPIQAQILLRLATTAEQAQHRRVSALAAWCDVRQPTVSDAVAALVRKGLVERTPVAGDARGVSLDLSTRGTAAVGRLASWDAKVREAVRRLDDVPLPAAAGNTPAMLEWSLRLIGELQALGVVTIARTCVTCRFFRPRVHDDAAAPHHCALLDAPLARAALRLDCPEHIPAA